jgi:hypothetical protein
MVRMNALCRRTVMMTRLVNTHGHGGERVRKRRSRFSLVHDGRATFVELKSPAGVASAAQRRVCAELRAAGANWYLARSAPAALEALRRANVPVRREWKSPPLPLWQGPFTDPDERLPQAPEVAAQRRAAQRRWRERQKAARTTGAAAEAAWRIRM